jgi:hypothetical protein
MTLQLGALALFTALVVGYVAGRVHARMLRVIAGAPLPPPALELDWEDPRAQERRKHPMYMMPPPPGDAGPPEPPRPPLDRPVSAREPDGVCEAVIPPDVAHDARVVDDTPERAALAAVREPGAVVERPRLGLVSNVVPIDRASRRA